MGALETTPAKICIQTVGINASFCAFNCVGRDCARLGGCSVTYGCSENPPTSAAENLQFLSERADKGRNINESYAISCLETTAPLSAKPIRYPYYVWWGDLCSCCQHSKRICAATSDPVTNMFRPGSAIFIRITSTKATANQTATPWRRSPIEDEFPRMALQEGSRA